MLYCNLSALIANFILLISTYQSGICQKLSAKYIDDSILGGVLATNVFMRALLNEIKLSLIERGQPPVITTDFLYRCGMIY
jgi:hypothetical protein